MNKQRTIFLALLVGIGLPTLPAHALDLGKWMKDTVEKGTQQVLEDAADTALAQLPSLSEVIESQVDEPLDFVGDGKVTLYGADYCPYAKRARAHLDARGVAYRYVDVQRHRKEFKRLGGRGVPVILVGTQRMDGFNAERLDRLLDNEKL